MKSKRKINRTTDPEVFAQLKADPEVLAQLKEWVALKTHVALEFWFVSGPLTLAGELHADADKPEAFFFATFSREIMVTLYPAVYETQSVKKSGDDVSVILKGFGGQMAVVPLTSKARPLFDAAPSLSGGRPN